MADATASQRNQPAEPVPNADRTKRASTPGVGPCPTPGCKGIPAPLPRAASDGRLHWRCNTCDSQFSQDVWVVTNPDEQPFPATGLEDSAQAVSAPVQQPATESVSTQPTAQPPVFAHSTDYRSLTFEGKAYLLTRGQATVVKLLHEASQRGTPAVGKDTLLAAIERETSRLRDSFRHSPLWGTLIVANRKPRGTYQLRRL
jgi:hypothetical protein